MDRKVIKHVETLLIGAKERIHNVELDLQISEYQPDEATMPVKSILLTERLSKTSSMSVEDGEYTRQGYTIAGIHEQDKLVRVKDGTMFAGKRTPKQPGEGL